MNINRWTNWFLSALGLISIVVSISFLYQLNATVVKAAGCPDNPYPECSCTFIGGNVIFDPGEHWYCYYNCTCYPGGGGEPFVIERTYETYD